MEASTLPLRSAVLEGSRPVLEEVIEVVTNLRERVGLESVDEEIHSTQDEGNAKSDLSMLPSELAGGTDFLRYVVSETDGRGAIAFTCVCVHCKIFPLEDFLWWVSGKDERSFSRVRDTSWRL